MKQIVFKIQKIKKKTTWTSEEDKLLISLVSPIIKNSWKIISEQFPRKTSYQCFLRYRSIKPDFKKGKWTTEEDYKILQGFQKFGNRWFLIAKIFHNRSAKQIRDRYINYLDPNVKKGKFSAEEDQQIVEFYQIYGPKWTKIQKYISCRTADAIKNRFISCLKKKLTFNEFSNNYSLASDDVNCYLCRF
jgi:myb proto-oncogene protein